MIAKFQGGPFHGQHRSVTPDSTTSDASEVGKPPITITVTEVREDVVQSVKYLRRPEKTGSAWEYVFVRPASS